MASPNKKWRNDMPPMPPSVTLYLQCSSNEWNPKVPHRDVGISNFGNTCFINACLQMLYHTPNIIKWLETTDHPSVCRKLLHCCTCQLLKTWRQYKCSKVPNIRPAAFVAVIRSAFRTPDDDMDNEGIQACGNKEEDAHEFLLFLLQNLEEDFLSPFVSYEYDFLSKLTNPIFENFGGWLITSCVCTSCSYSSNTYSPFTSLSLTIEECDKLTKINQKCQSVKDAIKYFLSGERVEEYLCVGCNRKQTIQKSFAVHKSPRILICQLKRFHHDKSKINDPVIVDNDFLLDDSEKSQYTLMGAVLHISASHSTGHYETVVKCPNGSWVKFSDERVSRMEHLPLHLLRTSAYVLFYSRTDRQKLEVVVASPGKPSHFVVRPIPNGQDKVSANLLGNNRFVVRPLNTEATSLDPESIFEDLGCAPLPVGDALLTFMGKVQPSVSPIKIVKKRKPLPNTSSSQSSHDYYIQSQNIGVSGQDGSLKKDTVSPLKIERHRRTVPKTSSSQSSHDYCIQSQNIGVSGQDGLLKKDTVSPLKIERHRRTVPKTSSSQSSHDYCIQSQNIGVSGQDGLLKKDTVSPLKIERHRRTVPKTSSSQSSHDYYIQSETIGVNRQDGSPSKKILTPLKVTWERRTNPNPKTISSLTFNDKLIQSEAVGLEKQDCSPSKGTASPLKIKWHQRTMESAITTSGEFGNEAGLQDNVADSLGSPSPKRKRGTMTFTASPLSAEDNWNEPNSFDDLFASPSPQKDRNRMLHKDVLQETIIDDPAGSPTMQGFQALKLLDTEVDGGVLPYKTVAQNNAQSLKRWLQCRGYPCYGKKEELVERVGLVMAKGDYHILDPKVDKGIWYNQKAADLQKNNVSSQPFTQEDLEPPSDLWHTFPSIPIPPLFNFGHIIYYLIETCPTLPGEDDSEEDCDHEEPVVLPDPFDDEHKTINEVKVLRKGLMFFKSKHVRALQDCSQGRCYFLKASVRASMEKEAYNVTVTLSLRSGNIHVCTCECIQQSLGRCVHVSSVLLALWSHIRLNGNGALTCTSLPKTWNKGSLQRDPGPIRDKQYDSFRIDIKRRAYFDPRPTKLQNSTLTQEEISHFLANLTVNPVDTLFQKHMKIKYEEETYAPTTLKNLSTLCRTFFDNLPSYKTGYDTIIHPPGGSRVYELPNTRVNTDIENDTETWKRMRSMHMTGKTAYQVLHLPQESSKKAFLRKHLWGLDGPRGAALQYGIDHEEDALVDYLVKMWETDESAYVNNELGLLKRDDYPEGAASVDAIKHSRIMGPKVVEVKCPYILRKHDPKKYREVLTASQRNSFCVGWDKSRQENYIKKGHDYYSQVQHYLGILGFESADLVVWSPKGMMIVEVPFDKPHWEKIKSAQIRVHRELLIPEYFLKRTPRELNPLHFIWENLQTSESDLEML